MFFDAQPYATHTLTSPGSEAEGKAGEWMDGLVAGRATEPPAGQELTGPERLLEFTAPNCTVLHCTALHCTALHCTAEHCAALHCAAMVHYFSRPGNPSLAAADVPVSQDVAGAARETVPRQVYRLYVDIK